MVKSEQGKNAKGARSSPEGRPKLLMGEESVKGPKLMPLTPESGLGWFGIGERASGCDSLV